MASTGFPETNEKGMLLMGQVIRMPKQERWRRGANRRFNVAVPPGHPVRFRKLSTIALNFSGFSKNMQ